MRSWASRGEEILDLERKGLFLEFQVRDLGGFFKLITKYIERRLSCYSYIIIPTV